MSPPPPGSSPPLLLRELIRPHLRRVALGSVLFTVAAATSMTQMWMIGRIVDEGLIAGSLPAFAILLSVTLVLVLVQPVAWILAFRQFYIAEARIQRRIAKRLADHLNAIGTGVRGATSSGEMVNLASADAKQTSSTVAHIGFLLNNTVMFAVGTAMVWAIHWKLAAVMIGGSCVSAFIVGPLLGRFQRRQSDYRADVGELTAQAADIVGGLRVLRGIGGDVMFGRRYGRRSAALREQGYRVAGANSWIHALRQAVPIAFLAAVTWVGAFLAAEEAITLGGLATAFSFATIFIAVIGAHDALLAQGGVYADLWRAWQGS